MNTPQRNEPLKIEAESLQPGDEVELWTPAHRSGPQGVRNRGWWIVSDEPMIPTQVRVRRPGVAEKTVDALQVKCWREVEIPEAVARQVGMLNPKGREEMWATFHRGHMITYRRKKT